MVLNSLSTLTYATEKSTNQIFKDVSPDDWFYESVIQSVNENIFSGISKDTFSPNESMTRAMYVTIMGRIAQVDNNYSNDNFSFTDLKADAYYVPYVMWAVEKGITQGIGNNQFSPDSKITREQMATFTVKFFDAYEIPYPENTVTILPKDLDEVSSWAREAVLKLWSCGLFKGDEKGNFNPENNATRAEAAALSVRINEKVEQWAIEIGKTEDPSSGNGSSATYYQLSFMSNGGSSSDSFSRREGGNMSNLPVPYKEGAVFGGWYYDKELTKLVNSNDLVRENLTMYAKWGDAVPLSEAETRRFASAIDQSKEFTITIIGLQSMSVDEVENLITVKNFNSQEDKEWVKIKKSGADFIVSGINYIGENGIVQNGFEEGASYKITLKDERLMFDDFPQEARDYNFTIKKDDVFNLSLNEKMDFIKYKDIRNIKENGANVSTINSTPLAVTENGSGVGDLVEGTFTYTQGSLAVGDTVTIYEGIHPNERVLDDKREGSDGNIAYVEITSVVGTTYGYQTADVEEVLFTPDVLPVSVDADTDGNAYNNSITVAEAIMDFAGDLYAPIGLDSQTAVDVGDYISFYDGDLTVASSGSNRPEQEGFGLITEVTFDVDTYVIAYEIVTLEEMLAAMDMYNTDPLDGDDMLKDLDIETFEAEIEQQAQESGFADNAGQYLAAMAMETKAFTEITEDFELRNYEIINQNGEPLSPEDVQLMADSDMSVKVEVDPPEASISTKLQQFEGISGLRLTLKIKAKITIGPKKPADGDAQVVINLTGEFEEEVHVGINIDGGARWEWWAIFPYIAEYEVTSNVDLFNYTGLKFHASIVTKEYNDKKWTDDEELINVVDELKKLVDEVKEGLGSEKEEDDPANDLIKKYKAMMDTESDWVTLVEKEMWSYSYRIPPIMIIEIKIELKFVIQANMNISLGAEFWYKTAKRYTYNVEIFAKNVTSDVIDLVEEQYEFTFYVMGTLGLRAGIKMEAKICLFTEKFASAGFAAEAGAYIKMYGYFYYQLTYKASVGKESKYSGALYFELGIYLEITFEAQAFAGTFSYNPTLYENEWPLWSAGMRENIQDYAYEINDAPELSLKKAIKTTIVPEDVFEMLYLDLKTGDSGTKIYDDSEKYFTIEMTNDKFSYDRSTNKLTIIPAENDITLDGQMVISWINQPLAWTSKPISIRINLHWDNLNDGYAIVFHSNGGSSIPIIIKKYGEVIVSPTNPVKKGYIFHGWYSDEDLTQRYTIPESMPNIDMEVYAKWTPATDTPYKVEHFGEILGSSQYEMLDTVELTGTTDSKVSAATKDYVGYTTPESKEITIAPDGSSILRYYYDREIYKLIFSQGVAQGDNLVSELKYGAKITVPILKSKGYAFAGWSPAIADNATMPAEDITYTAQWAPANDTPYRVEYYVEQTNGKYILQRLDDTKTGSTGSQVDLLSIFDNSYLVENGISYRETTVNGEATTAPIITKDGKLIIKVNYQRESNDAIFDPDNGEDSTTINVKYQSAITQPSQNPTKQGYVFAGWEGYTVNTIMGTADITYTARWEPAENNVYTVKHIREDLSGSYPVSGDLVETETKIGTTEAQTEAHPKYYEGFTANVVNQVEILPDGTTELEIRYSRNSYTVNWIAEGNAHKTEQVKYGKPITEPTSNPTKQGYVFASWSGLGVDATMGITEKNFTATWDPATDTIYTVKHIREDLSGNYTIEELEEKEGTTGTPTSASPKTYEGFTANTNYALVDIEPDGSSVATILYKRNSYSITWIANNEIYETTHTAMYGEEIALPNGTPNNKTGYTFGVWNHVPDTMPAKDSSYEASWTANTYTVTFNVTSGAVVDVNTKEVTYDSSYDELPTPTYAGYQFVNWTDESGATVTATTTVRTASDHELTATWAANDATAYIVQHYVQNIEDDGYVQYVSDVKYGETGTNTAAVANSYLGFTVQNFIQEYIEGDGSTVVKIYYSRNVHTITWNIDGIDSTVNYRYGESITAPEATRTGYTFEGWDVVVASAMPDGNLKYTATWLAKQYEVSFNGNGGSTPSAMTVTYDSTYAGLPTPTRIGYEFDGWFTSASGGTKVVESTSVEITTNQTLYAHWTAKQYTVSFDLNTGAGTAPEIITVTYNDTYTALPENSASKTGYTFTGWYTAASGGSKITSTTSVSTTSEHTLYARWQANTYNVVFDANGGSGTMVNQSLTYDQSQSLIANGFTKIGNSFSGWNTQNDGSGTGYTNTASVTNLATEGIITLYAKWTVKEYNISFDNNGGSVVTSIIQNYGTAITAPDAPTKDGYTFDSWQYGGVDYTFSTMPAENITLTARWNTVDYTITYELNGGTNHATNPSSYNIESGNITLGDANGKAGHTFEGWYKEETFANKVQGIAIAAGITGEKTFYAKWIPNTYTVIFDKNIGDGTTNVGQGFTYNEAAKALTANTFTRDGYTFDGWNTKPDGTGTNYTDMQVVINLAESGNVNLYAKWKLVTYSITYQLGGGTQASGNLSSYTVNSNDMTLNDPSRDGGYGFMGWYENASFTGNKVTSITKGSTGDKTLYAKWGFAGTFTVTNNGNNSFTITRNGNGNINHAQNVGQQTVYFRTINGSAIGGTHFYHQGGSSAAVSFADGEISKTVTITEYGVIKSFENRIATSYSNIDRTYQLELVKVVGGGLLGSTNKATRTMAKDNNYVVASDVYNYKSFVSHTVNAQISESIGDYVGTQYTGLSGNPLTGRSDSTNVKSYLQDTASAMRVRMDITGADDGWRMIRHVFFNNHTNGTSTGKDKSWLGTLPTGTKAAFVYGLTSEDNNTLTYTVGLPAADGEISAGVNAVTVLSKYATGQSSNDYILYALNETCGISIAAYNSATAISTWWYKGGILYSAPFDTKEPSMLGIAPMATGDYKVGETVTIAVVFDEIVANQNGATISGLNLNTMTYSGGVGSNVLYFTGTVKNDCNQDTILTGINLNGTVLDMVN
jgi:uncharacterized repeat protein (TIGR02543 family)